MTEGEYAGGCNCASKPPTTPTLRNTFTHLDDCPAKGSRYPVGVVLSSAWTEDQWRADRDKWAERAEKAERRLEARDYKIASLVDRGLIQELEEAAMNNQELRLHASADLLARAAGHLRWLAEG